MIREAHREVRQREGDDLLRHRHQGRPPFLQDRQVLAENRRLHDHHQDIHHPGTHHQGNVRPGILHLGDHRRDDRPVLHSPPDQRDLLEHQRGESGLVLELLRLAEVRRYLAPPAEELVGKEDLPAEQEAAE